MNKGLFLAVLVGGLVLAGAGCAKPGATMEGKVETKTTIEDGTGTNSVSATAPESTSVVADGTYEVSLDKSEVTWGGDRLDGSHHQGTLDLKAGTATAAGGKIASGEFTIDMATLAESKDNERVETHLKSKDFFEVDKYPTAVFKLTKPVVIDASGSALVTGDFTMKGITKEISFPALIRVVAGEVTAVANFNLDRTMWDVKYGSGKFFKSLGDKLIKDDMQIGFRLFATKK